MIQPMIQRWAIILAVGLFGFFFAKLAIEYQERQTLPPLARSYVELGPAERGTANVTTAILLTYRAFDTLGEVAVLFLVTAGLGLLLGKRESSAQRAASSDAPVPSSEIVQSGTEFLLPLIAIFAAYIIMNGHLSAGGGFQGGAIIASAVMLLLIAHPEMHLNLGMLSKTESIAGLLIVLVGLCGVIWAAGFLDNRLLPLGKLGGFFSAGAIPVLSALLGIKVGCELSVIIDRMRG